MYGVAGCGTSGSGVHVLLKSIIGMKSMTDPVGTGGATNHATIQPQGDLLYPDANHGAGIFTNNLGDCWGKCR